MIRESALAEAAYAIQNTRLGKAGAAKVQADLLGISPQTLYRQLKAKGLYQCDRKKRADKGEVRIEGVDDDMILNVAALMLTSARNQGRIIMPAEVAIEIAESSGMIPKGVLLPSTLNRHLRKLEADKRSMLAAEPHIKVRSLHPNHYHQLDYSVCVQWYLDKKGMGERDMVTQVYKNKPDNVADAHAKGKNKLIRAVLTDHFTGLIYIRYYYIPGESARMAIDFLSHAWREKEDGNPFHGAPLMLGIDKTGAHRDSGFLAFLDALGVTPETHAAGNSKASGQVECAQRIVEQRIESRLRISPAKSVEELNELAALECRKLNATMRHSRHRQTRAGLWQTIKAEHLRTIKVAHDDLLALANKESRSVKVKGDYTIQFDGDTYKVFDIPGISPRMKLEARRNVFDIGTIQIRIHSDEPWIAVQLEERMSDLDGGWAADAQVVGEGYSKATETKAMQHNKTMTRAAYGADTDRDAENARKRREKPFAGVDAFASSKEFQHPSYMKRKGTELPLAATAQPELLYTGIKMIKRVIAVRGSRLSPEENQALKSAFPNGMSDDDINDWINNKTATPALRAVG